MIKLEHLIMLYANIPLGRQPNISPELILFEKLLISRINIKLTTLLKNGVWNSKLTLGIWNIKILGSFWDFLRDLITKLNIYFEQDLLRTGLYRLNLTNISSAASRKPSAHRELGSVDYYMYTCKSLGLS